MKYIKKYSDSVECEDFVEKLDRRAVKLRYNAYCNNAKKYRNNFDVEEISTILMRPTYTPKFDVFKFLSCT